MADDREESEKTEQPSQRRIDEFREKGDVASSKDLIAVLIMAGTFGALSLSLFYIYETMSDFITWIFTLNAAEAYSDESLKTITTNVASTILKCSAPVCLTALCVGVLSQVAQIGFLFSPDILSAKFDRINPLNGFKKIFSLTSLFEAVKALLKFVFIIAILYFTMKADLGVYSGYLHMDFFSSMKFGQIVITKMGFIIIASLFVIAALDFGWQKFQYSKKIKQTKQETKKESKEQEGNPEIKQRIRTIQRELSSKRMLSKVKSADVIVTNPTHLSIVIKYDSEKMISPTVIGKGADHLALRIREIAKENNIPIVENIMLARTLYQTVKEGEGVPRVLYKAVAEVLAFVYRLKKKKKALQTNVKINRNNI